MLTPPLPRAESWELVPPGVKTGELGEPEEIAQIVAFVASGPTAFITGADISGNGGQHMG